MISEKPNAVNLSFFIYNFLPEMELACLVLLVSEAQLEIILTGGRQQRCHLVTGLLGAGS